MYSELSARVLIALVAVVIGISIGAWGSSKTLQVEGRSEPQSRTIGARGELPDARTTRPTTNHPESRTSEIVATTRSNTECPSEDAEYQALLGVLGLDLEELRELAEDVQQNEFGEHREGAPSLSQLISDAGLTSEEAREVHLIVRDLQSEVEAHMRTQDPAVEQPTFEQLDASEYEVFFSPAELVETLDVNIGILVAMRDAQSRLNQLLGPERLASLSHDLTDVTVLADAEPDYRGI